MYYVHLIFTDKTYSVHLYTFSYEHPFSIHTNSRTIICDTGPQNQS